MEDYLPIQRDSDQCAGNCYLNALDELAIPSSNDLDGKAMMGFGGETFQKKGAIF